MLVLNIEDIKGFMNKLLSSEAWDSFRLYEAEVKNAAFLQIDGKLNPDFFDNQEEMQGQTYIAWKDIKGVFYQAIRGKRLPLSFKLIFMPEESVMERVIAESGLSIQRSEVAALNLNVYYERGSLRLTTGSALKIFTMDKSLDYAWEACVKTFLKQMEIL
jgi:hypothetical protein